MSFNRISVIWAMAAISVAAQTKSPQPLEFEVASIKLNTSGSGNSSSNGSAGGVVYTNRTLMRLIEQAYGVKRFQVTGPDWMENIRFDIDAKYPSGSNSTDRPLMLRALLEDRFAMTVHRDVKEVPGYELVVAKNGFKLQPVESSGDSSSDSQSGGRIRTLTAKQMSMAGLAAMVASNLDAAVIDKTGIGGVYDLELRWSNDDLNTTGGDDAPTLFTALQETLGLRLQSKKVPVEIIVVDHIERVPTDN